jgi:hypothetical protein
VPGPQQPGREKPGLPGDSAPRVFVVGDTTDLKAFDALEVLAEVTRAVTRWRTVVKSHGLVPQDLDVMEPAFEHAEGERARVLTKIRPARSS